MKSMTWIVIYGPVISVMAQCYGLPSVPGPATNLIVKNDQDGIRGALPALCRFNNRRYHASYNASDGNAAL